VLDKLLQLGIRPEVVVALALVPLAEVAWADGKLDSKERKVVLKRVEESGIAPGSTDYALLESWLKRRPEPRLLTAWSHMVRGLCEYMTAEEIEGLRANLVERVQAIASASGGLLGMGKISAAEADTIRRLESVFPRK
jgi:hypothetical protein